MSESMESIFTAIGIWVCIVVMWLAICAVVVQVMDRVDR